jgi:deoxyribodipyrimidine photo-lyase
MQDISIVWLRRDLRLDDQAALHHALKGQYPVLPLFIFDTNILNKLEDKQDRRVDFLHQTLSHLKSQLNNLGSDIYVANDTPLNAYKKISSTYNIVNVFTNHDYEPYALERDTELANWFKENNINFETFKDQVIFEKLEVTKDDGLPYTVFTPYSKKWKAAVTSKTYQAFECQPYYKNFLSVKNLPMPTLESIGFVKTGMAFSIPVLDETIVKNYHNTRDIPSVLGTSRLSIHLRFGTVSVRNLAAKATTLNEKFLNELIWRDFYQQILWNFPHVVKGSFRPQYDAIIWRNNETEFKAWCDGKTGYPIVDAGMRELNETGWMHNRVRMIVASFLTKHLLIDWRWGELYFANKLNDFDLASNNGGWQWASGSGVDAAPYFRVFNPRLQTEKFDKALAYINKWIPELNSFEYPKPIVDHDMARKRCLEVYKAGLTP